MLTLSVMSNIKEYLKTFATIALPKLLGTILIVVAGWIAVKIIISVVRKALDKSGKLDVSLVNFILNTINICLKVLILLSALTNLGISTTGIIAAFSACAVAISLALKDSLSNIAAGIIMLISRPFSTGDFVEADGCTGTVLKIDLVHTTLRTPDNRQVVIPNGQLMNMTITDYSKESNRRVELKFSISYDNDPEAAKKIMLDASEAHSLVLKDPEPFARVTEHGDSGVIIILRVWCKNADYWTVHFDLLENIRRDFDKNGIVIPYNQLDVRIVGKDETEENK